MTDFKSRVLYNLKQDPGLPVSNPSSAFWQSPPHALANTQSAHLPERVDIAIIGSGITGCSIARSLLGSTDQNTTVAVFEARSLCSGATGRNGGHLVSGAVHDFAGLKAAFGEEQAAKAARFTFRNIERVWQVVREELDPHTREASEIRAVTSTLNFTDKRAWEEYKWSVAEFNAAVPELAGMVKLIDGREAVETLKFTSSVGAAQQPAGAMWPYRLITGIFVALVKKYSARFTIETNTPVTGVTYNAEEGEYTLSTPRGSVRARRVVHCTNAFASHLLPSLRGRLFPLRGTMTVQERPPAFPNDGATRSWSFASNPTFDARSGLFSYGLYYMTQNAATGDLFLGGERQRVDQLLVADDSVIGDLPAQNLRSLLPRLFSNGGAHRKQPPATRQAWSGIMGFTADSMPVVGRLEEEWTGRAGSEEWIAAGFNGFGMDKCWLTGEAVAAMMIGESVDEWLPDVYRIRKARFLDGCEERVWETFGGASQEAVKSRI
ncbi:hypothetical protein ASPZODRAFT_24961 [Penicilliopsis zonata CBS 506.65]|uniref:FAD dependent oxidoreductase domain-containing protein n=1 Tax=Penicilliopsis zonata CBS 506.65 TaxID=1073090 RepID=A0A1L9SI28_9EURO|nr:hypothetical protein ASPZODRAFT_24961 [Penicilliopsis zonata CBS 506.65]OJJ46865.1 hypothetical protein ASPZODRAFT_24961 [Penicilliopsis zonata CBS 506.65]